ncbi:hypothetical protein F3Y22_tig00111191pilonHSYRG00200 [Hibiscus syriacus]|uniref:Uncharacterized protein n=1 Tax=Hibiscus syriacus TaxID=106335 RepID=A0A6A2YWG2_HIBSY|nr:hypothetical protein F3Y22_tig00111191pilonHSYRG00200 [Hibiscus syriacus]
MARFSLFFLIVIVSLIFHPTCFEARKLLNFEMKQAPPFKGNFAGIKFSKEPTKMLPASDDDEGHAMVSNERRFAFRLAEIDRILQSHPSPGGGH